MEKLADPGELVRLLVTIDPERTNFLAMAQPIVIENFTELDDEDNSYIEIPKLNGSVQDNIRLKYVLHT